MTIEPGENSVATTRYAPSSETAMSPSVDAFSTRTESTSVGVFPATSQMWKTLAEVELRQVVVYAVAPRTKISPVARAGLKAPQPSTVMALVGAGPVTAAQLPVLIGSVTPGLPSAHAAPNATRQTAASALRGGWCCRRLRRI